jgi:hypothetical protein
VTKSPSIVVLQDGDEGKGGAGRGLKNGVLGGI